MGITAYTWETAETPPDPTANMKPMYVAVLSNTGMTPGEIGTAAYQSIEEDPTRPLFLRHIGEQRTGTDDIKNATYYDFMVNGPRVSGWRSAMEEFWVAWAQAGNVRPSRIVLEFEQHYSWYAIPGENADRAAAIQSVRDAGYSKRYPAAINALTQAQLAAHSNHNSPTAAAVVAHDIMAKQRMNKAMTEIAIGTYAKVMGSAVPPCGNYGDLRLRDGFTSAYGYTYPAGKSMCVGSDSSPELYFYPDGARYSAISGSGPKQFAAMKGEIERVRACRGRVVPWVGPPGYRGGVFAQQTSPSAWAGWRKFIHTLGLHGVSEVLYFIGNYVHETGERAYADETFATATTVRPRPIDRFQKPSIDTTTLLTGTGGWVENEFAYNINDWS